MAIGYRIEQLCSKIVVFLFKFAVAGNDWFVDQFDKILFDDLLLKTDGNSKDPFNLDDFIDTSKTKDVPAAKKPDSGLNGNQVSKFVDSHEIPVRSISYTCICAPK